MDFHLACNENVFKRQKIKNIYIRKEKEKEKTEKKNSN